MRSHIDWIRERVPARTLDPEGGQIVRFHIGWGEERNILYKGKETSLWQTHFKNLERMPERERFLRRTISANGGLEQLHVLSSASQFQNTSGRKRFLHSYKECSNRSDHLETFFGKCFFTKDTHYLEDILMVLM